MATRFVHPGQMIPLHIPHRQVMAESTVPIGASSAANFPRAYYPGLHSQHDGRPVQWVFYPISIPVNAVRPIIAEKCLKSESEIDNSSLVKLQSPENITSDMMENVSSIDNELVKPTILNSVTEIHPRNALISSQVNQPSTEKLKYHNIADDFNKASSLLRDQGPTRVAGVTSPNEKSNMSNCSTVFTKTNNLTDEINRLSALHPREALLTKKRQQLSGIVDRVTEVAASKQSIAEQKKSSAYENIGNVPSPLGTPLVRPINETPLVSSINDGNDLIETYTDEVAMESAVIKNKQYCEIEKSVERPAFHPRFSLISNVKHKLINDNPLPVREEEEDQGTKDISSFDSILHILRSPPDFKGNKTQNTDIPIFTHPRKVLYNRASHPSVKKTPEPNAFEQKVISEVSNSIISLHSTESNHVPSVENKTSSDDSDDSRNIFRELERNAILEANQLREQQLKVNELGKTPKCQMVVSAERTSKGLDNTVRQFETTKPIVNTMYPLRKPDKEYLHNTHVSTSDSLDGNDTTEPEIGKECKDNDHTGSVSDEYHALKEISILQSANYPLPDSFQKLSETLISHKIILNESGGTGKQQLNEDVPTNTCNFVKRSSTNNFERLSERTRHNVYEIDYNDECNNNGDDCHVKDGDDYGHTINEDEPFFNPITFLNYCYKDFKTLDSFNPNLIVRDVLQMKHYKHLLTTEDEGDESETVHCFKPPPQKLKEYSTRKKMKLNLKESIAKEEEEVKKKRKKNKLKDIPLRTDRIKRCKIGVFYKDTRTYFVKAPLR